MSEMKLIIDGALDGSLNMAIDSDILNAVNAGESGPVLRFYQWREPTISLGYFQDPSEVNSLDEQLRALPVVKRITGGGAILHDRELTYSLTIPLSDNRSVNDLYRFVHDHIIAILQSSGIDAGYRGFSDKGNSQRGPFFCFARNHSLDIVTPKGKILGSAQRRLKHAVLQHGSLILEKRFSQHPGAFAGKDFDIGTFADKLYMKLTGVFGQK